MNPQLVDSLFTTKAGQTGETTLSQMKKASLEYETFDSGNDPLEDSLDAILAEKVSDSMHDEGFEELYLLDETVDSSPVWDEIFASNV